MQTTPRTRIFQEGTTATEIAKHVAAILCDGHPDLYLSQKKRKFAPPPTRSIFARAVKWEDKSSLRKAIHYLEQDGMAANDIEIIKATAKRTMEDVFGTLINKTSQSSRKKIIISDKDMAFNDLYYMGARFMGREFTPDEKIMIREKLINELQKNIYPRVVLAFGASAAEETLAAIKADLAQYPQTTSQAPAKPETPKIKIQIPDGLG